ncbi:diguanylate cyclase [Montanilutibacter psychrotolerans]|uniref:diguanylate cyclase n=1 Tax=Montanilutibacter psychrotolerans TaxID=1327343 RepID=A0A3M8SWF2_9GAMM|nr:diguanylate cyclase [Lysobacter psychrotolerans]RNF83786.1 diguanylate cyclase [Lysobacter psychrotolerans]
MSTDGDPGASAGSSEHRRFVARIYRMRILGLGTGCIAISGVLYENGASLLTWMALAFNGGIWPTVAYAIARGSRDPKQAEFRNLAIDSICGGIWIAVMQFNVVPSALLAVMLSADKIGVGGWRFLARTASVQALACLATWALLGFGFRPDTTMTQVLVCLPFMVAYPLAISTAAYALGRKVVRQNRMLDRLNRTDGLTGLPNRLHWEEAAVTELSRCSRTRRPAALLMFDIDNFKQINDSYGHPAGDEVLRRVAASLRASLRALDTPGRFGGDEFGVVLGDTDSRDAMDVAERLRATVAAIRIEGLPDLRCTISVGVAFIVPRLDSVNVWIRHADTALYRAKQTGRNRVCTSGASWE